MNILTAISGVIFLLLLTVLILGLINPKWILRRSKKPNRWKVFGWWILAAFIYVMVVGSAVQYVESKQTPAEIIASSAKNINNGNYSIAIERLKRITPKDSLYTAAQELIHKADGLSKKTEGTKTEEVLDRSKNNGTLEIILINLPDSVVFKPAKGTQFEFNSGALAVYLVSGTNIIKSKKISVSGDLYLGIKNTIDSTMHVHSKPTTICGDKNRLTAKKFKPPENFKAQKIMFIVDKKTMYYNLDISEWE